ncbi:MAG: hypothetical protein F6K56_45480 [Moorea sp. SIO3G5]|nr:hypothetical protein [Moorena sp. SIO3G5]
MRYGADYPNIGYEVEHAGKPAPKAPYSTRLPIPDSRFPTPPKIYKTFQNML